MSWIDTSVLPCDSRPATEQEEFLAALRVSLTVAGALRHVPHISQDKVYRWLNHDESFQARFNDAKRDAVELLEAKSFHRAAFGEEKPVYQSGKQVMNGDGTPATVLDFSDTMAIFMLKGHKRAVYGDKLDVSHHGMVAKAYHGVNLTAILQPAPEEPAGELPPPSNQA